MAGGFAPKATLSLAPGCGLQTQECHLVVFVVVGSNCGIQCVFFRWGILSPNSGNLP